MALAVDATSSAAFVDDSTISWSHTTSGSDRILIVGVSWDQVTSANITVSSVTYNGTALTHAVTRRIIDGSTPDTYDYNSALYYLIAPSTGANNIVVTMSGQCDLTAGAVSFTGAHQTSPNGGTANNGSSSGAASVSITSSADEIVVGLYSGYNAQSPTAATSAWSRSSGSGFASNGAYMAHPVTSIAWSPDNSWYWATVAVRVVPSGAASSSGAGNAAGTSTVDGAGGNGGLVVVKAFPTAEGFGADSVGGRGGTIHFVTNLNDSGAGSLRAACEASGARIVVFRTGGTITLLSDIVITNPYITIAGQTATGDGILIRNYGIWFTSPCHDVIVRHLRLRVGVAAAGDRNGFLVWGDEDVVPDSLVYNIILDHCSVSWANDQNCDVFRYADLVTFQWCIIAEGATTGHSGGAEHSTGTIIGREGGPLSTTRVSIHHCLYAHCGARNPLISFYLQGTSGLQALIDLRNNVAYNWRGNNYCEFQTWFNSNSQRDAWDDTSTGIQGNVVRNHYIPGPDSSGDDEAFCWVFDFVKIYAFQNMGPAFPTTPPTSDHWNTSFRYIQYDLSDFSSTEINPAPTSFQSLTEFTVPTVSTSATTLVKDLVLDNAGATVPSRDAVDTRIVAQVRAGTGTIGIGSGYPTITGAAAPTDSDNDGIPNTWENSHGLNPNSSADGNATAANGYTNIENYLNELAGDALPGGAPATPAVGSSSGTGTVSGTGSSATGGTQSGQGTANGTSNVSGIGTFTGSPVTTQIQDSSGNRLAGTFHV